MAELDQYKLNEVKSFRDKLVSTGMISQSMVAGLEDVLGFNPITSVKRIQHFTGTESHYGCNDVISILNNLLDSEPGTESITPTTYRNPDTMLGIASNLLNFLLPKDDRSKKRFRNNYNIFNKIFKVNLDNVYLSDRDDFRGLKIGNLTGPEFLKLLTGEALSDDRLRIVFQDDLSSDLEAIKNIIAAATDINALGESADPYTIKSEESEFARSIYKLAFETLLGPEEIIKVPGYTTESVSFNLYTINEFLNRSGDILHLLDNARKLCSAARTIYRNNEIFHNMSLSSLLASFNSKSLNGSTVYQWNDDKRRDYVKLNNKSLSSMAKLLNKDKESVDSVDYMNARYYTRQTRSFLESLFELIVSDEKYVRISMLDTDMVCSSSPGYGVTNRLTGLSCNEDCPTTILRYYLEFLALV